MAPTMAPMPLWLWQSEKALPEHSASLYIPCVKPLGSAYETFRHFPVGDHARHSLVTLNLTTEGAVGHAGDVL